MSPPAGNSRVDPPPISRRNALAASVVVTGAAALLADKAGLRAAIRYALADRGLPIVVANLLYFGAALFLGSLVYRTLTALPRLRAALHDPKPALRHKKSWAAAMLLWLALVYPLSSGPVGYCVGRGWLAASAMRFYRPVTALILRIPDSQAAAASFDGFRNYAGWWRDLGERHAPPPPPAPLAPVTPAP